MTPNAANIPGELKFPDGIGDLRFLGKAAGDIAGKKANVAAACELGVMPAIIFGVVIFAAAVLWDCSEVSRRRGRDAIAPTRAKPS